ncbi:C40 family peptidase [Roseateles sp.]|uniref:C40 family peptidase n=1 Tax=Roseateles sp. TaxID=1971397 RepID=UPI003963A572
MPVSRALARPLSLLTLCLALGLGLAPAVRAQGVAQAAVTQPAPPPGTMMGSYGASLQQQALAAAAAPNRSAANDAVTRFLTERGLVPAPDSAPARLLGSVRDTASELVLSAMNFLGVRYTRGGTSIENGFDCSGFTRHIFEMSVGLVLPRRADEQARAENLKAVEKDELKPGDLVFFNTMRRTFSHVGIYVGEGRFIHAPRTGSAVRVEDMRDAYWAKRFTGARRADLKAAAAAEPQTVQR